MIALLLSLLSFNPQMSQAFSELNSVESDLTTFFESPDEQEGKGTLNILVLADGVTDAIASLPPLEYHEILGKLGTAYFLGQWKSSKINRERIRTRIEILFQAFVSLPSPEKEKLTHTLRGQDHKQTETVVSDLLMGLFLAEGIRSSLSLARTGFNFSKSLTGQGLPRSSRCARLIVYSFSTPKLTQALNALPSGWKGMLGVGSAGATVGLFHSLFFLEDDRIHPLDFLDRAKQKTIQKLTQDFLTDEVQEQTLDLDLVELSVKWDHWKQHRAEQIYFNEHASELRELQGELNLAASRAQVSWQKLLETLSESIDGATQDWIQEHQE